MKTLFNALMLALMMNATVPANAVSTETFQEIAKHTVNVLSEDGTGTGTIIDQHHVLTAFHVVPDKDGNYLCVLPDGYIVFAQVERSDPASDLAMLVTLSPLGDDGATIATQSPMKFQAVATVGFPLGMEVPVATEGVFNALLPENNILSVFTLSITFGNSGGGVYAIDKYGHPTLTGVVHAMSVSTYIGIDYPTFHLLLGISYQPMVAFLKPKFEGFGLGG
jgi:S1-C subfamily serine protease